MSTLREEYQKKKITDKAIVNEATLAWVQKNVIIISERISRSAVKRLSDSIARFDEKFSILKEKLPTMQKILDEAELGLQLVVTGKTSDKRATTMLKHMSMVYNILSDFFAVDLSLLLKTPMFKAAQEDVTVPLIMVKDSKNSIDVVQDAFENALRPTKDEIKLLGRIYKNIPIPTLNAKQIAGELTTLSYAELVELTKVGKVPMVTTSNEPKESSQELNEEIISEALNQEEMDSLVYNLRLLQKAFDANKEFFSQSQIDEAFANLVNDAQRIATDTSFLTKIKDFTGLFRTEQGKIIAQAQMAVEMFRNLATLTPQIQTLFRNPNLDQSAIQNLQKVLSNKLKGGFFAQLKSSLFSKIQPYPGLSPDDLMAFIVSLAQEPSKEQTKEPQAKPQQPQPPGQPEVPPPFPGRQNIKENKFLNEDGKALQKFFQNLSGFEKGYNNNFNSKLTKQTQTQNKQQDPQQSNQQGQQGQQGSQSKTTPIELNQQSTDEQLKAIESKIGIDAGSLRKLATTRGVRITVDPRLLMPR